MTEQSPAPPQPEPRSPQLATAPTTPPVADALRALGPDYEEALVSSIAARVDELARERETSRPVPAPPAAAPSAAVPYVPSSEHRHREGNPGLPVSILSLIFGFVITVVSLTAGLAIGGPLALVAILIVWIALIAINFAVWRGHS